MNDKGFRTYNSCQDNNGMIWIEFLSLECYRKFEFALFDDIDKNYDAIQREIAKEFIFSNWWVNSGGLM